MFKYMIKRLQEPSTWRGLIMIATASGVAIAPELMPVIVAAGTGAAGAVGVLTEDKVND